MVDIGDGVACLEFHTFMNAIGQEIIEMIHESLKIVEKDFAGKVAFLAQNVKTADFGDAVFRPYVQREINGVACAIIGQAFPYTPIANPRYFVPEWSFGIQDDNMQKMVDEAREPLGFLEDHADELLAQRAGALSRRP